MKIEMTGVVVSNERNDRTLFSRVEVREEDEKGISRFFDSLKVKGLLQLDSAVRITVEEIE